MNHTDSNNRSSQNDSDSDNNDNGGQYYLIMILTLRRVYQGLATSSHAYFPCPWHLWHRWMMWCDGPRSARRMVTRLRWADGPRLPRWFLLVRLHQPRKWGYILVDDDVSVGEISIEALGAGHIHVVSRLIFSLFLAVLAQDRQALAAHWLGQYLERFDYQADEWLNLPHFTVFSWFSSGSLGGCLSSARYLAASLFEHEPFLEKKRAPYGSIAPVGDPWKTDDSLPCQTCKPFLESRKPGFLRVGKLSCRTRMFQRFILGHVRATKSVYNPPESSEIQCLSSRATRSQQGCDSCLQHKDRL